MHGESSLRARRRRGLDDLMVVLMSNDLHNYSVSMIALSLGRGQAKCIISQTGNSVKQNDDSTPCVRHMFSSFPHAGTTFEASGAGELNRWLIGLISTNRPVEKQRRCLLCNTTQLTETCGTDEEVDLRQVNSICKGSRARE